MVNVIDIILRQFHYLALLNVQDMADKIADILDDEKLKTELITKGKKSLPSTLGNTAPSKRSKLITKPWISRTASH